jgi:type IV secretory pathway VirB10-like protein
MKRPQSLRMSSNNPLSDTSTHTTLAILPIIQTFSRFLRQPMAERLVYAQKGKYPPTKMTGQGNEDAEHVHVEKDVNVKEDKQSSRNEEASQEKEEKTPVKSAKSKEKGKGGSKSDASDSADDDSDKNNLDDDVPLSFPQRVSCCMIGLDYLFAKWFAFM